MTKAGTDKLIPPILASCFDCWTNVHCEQVATALHGVKAVGVEVADTANGAAVSARGMAFSFLSTGGV